METIDIKELLLKQFGDTFAFHPAFYDDFTKLVLNSGEEKKIVSLFLRRLLAIVELDGIDYGVKWIEHLKKYKNMYSLHVDTENKNFRLLFSRTLDKKYFLHMFYEKSGKEASSYAKHVPIALERRDMNRGVYDEQ